MTKPNETSVCRTSPVTFVPGLPVLSPSSNVGNSQDSPQMSHKDEAGDAVAWRDGDVKTTVAVQKTWMGAVQFDALLVNNEHGDLSAILGGVEDLGGKNIETDTERKKQSQDMTTLGTDGSSKYAVNTQIIVIIIIVVLFGIAQGQRSSS